MPPNQQEPVFGGRKNVAINGFGRIGRACARALANHPTLRVTHINDPMPAAQAAYLLKYDSVMQPFFGDIRVDGERLLLLEQPIRLSHDRDVTGARWREMGVDFVVNSSGVNNDKATLERYLENGARRVIVSAPAPEAADAHILMGVNNMDLRPEHRVISGGSCTAHCFAPIVAILAREFRILRGFMHTVHAYTSSQNLMDGPHESDPRRGRAAADNIVPTTTESIKAFEAALPAFRGLLKGMATRVPVSAGSNVDLTLQLDQEIPAQTLNDLVRSHAEGGLRRIVQYSDEPLVSSDIVGNPHSCVFDSLLTETHGPLARFLLWYDNEWAYTNRLVELLELISYLR